MIIDQTEEAGLGQCPLVLGECVQGQTREQQHFLITAPIGLFSWAEFTSNGKHAGLTVAPGSCWKALRAVELYLIEHELPRQGHLKVVTPLAAGQGFGTSTADITASLRATAAHWGRSISPEEIARIAISIEPSDGSMYPGSVAFAHREGKLIEQLGELPRFEALVILTGGTVDTIEFDERRRYFRYCQRDEDDLIMAWRAVRQAVLTRDAALMAYASTISARINEQLLPKLYFDDLHRFVQLECANGLMVAHSGTAIALILDPARRDHRERLAQASSFVSSLRPPAWFHISNRNVQQKITMQYPGAEQLDDPAALPLVI
jgi:L-threonine kinase